MKLDLKTKSTWLAGICAFLTTGSAMAATAVWQGGTAAYTDANWTIDGTPDQTGPNFGSPTNDNDVVNMTIDGGTVNAFNNADVGAIGGSDTLLITGGAKTFGDFLNAGPDAGQPGVSEGHDGDITLENGSMTFSSLNVFRSTDNLFDGLINFTGAAGSVFVRQTDNSGTVTQKLAGKIASTAGTRSYFRLDGTLVTTNGVSYDGTNLAAINAELASQVIGGRYFQIEESGSTQTLYLEAAAPGAADPQITSFAVSGDTATVTMTGDDSVGYWCASSTDLSGFTTEETALQTGTATPIATNPDGSFNTSGGTLTFDVDVTGDSKLFLRIQDADPSP